MHFVFILTSKLEVTLYKFERTWGILAEENKKKIVYIRKNIGTIVTYDMLARRLYTRANMKYCQNIIIHIRKGHKDINNIL